ncbi:HAMP domain-containing histidine kinase [Seohaeicola saemankumensis]|nr:HAMP domain-containing sensor histidine kinase [Seohaeicola saemankumensis]MCA0869803.1 HAMP domain-containing histidine kinase [Seohaeicola saemankumensis]
MELTEDTLIDDTTPSRAAQLEQQIRDYYIISTKLIWQRQAIFLAATILTSFYFDPSKSFGCYGAVLFTELVDLVLARRVQRRGPYDMATARRFLTWILFNTVLSSLAICVFVFVVATQQSIGGHFTPLFFLFAAALFAAMNNHQLVPALAVRLTIYGVTFFAIVLMDIWRVRPPLSSELWLHFFTVVFVLYFIIDCSFVFLRLYRKNLRQLQILRAEHERTKAAYVAKSQFVSTVSHELRTPLTSIKGSLDLMTSGMLGQVPEQMKSLLDIAGKNSARLANLINDILDLQKIEAGEMVYNFEVVDVRMLVQEAVDSNLGYAGSLGVEILTELDEADPVYIKGDEGRLMQVMANIISNALKFSNEDGKVTVSYRVIGDKVRIFVKDEGVGIPENARDKVFDKFSQVDSTDQRKVGGTGLGMNISKQIVENHNGEIDYVSQLGQGTVFHVEFDIQPIAEQQAA